MYVTLQVQQKQMMTFTKSCILYQYIKIASRNNKTNKKPYQILVHNNDPRVWKNIGLIITLIAKQLGEVGK